MQRLYPITVLISSMALVAALPARAVLLPAAAGPRCRIEIRGSTGAAFCRNPTTAAVDVELHILCRRWWDPAVDSQPVEVGPGQTAVLADRCWKEIHSVWVTRR